MFYLPPIDNITHISHTYQDDWSAALALAAA